MEGEAGLLPNRSGIELSRHPLPVVLVKRRQSKIDVSGNKCGIDVTNCFLSHSTSILEMVLGCLERGGFYIKNKKEGAISEFCELFLYKAVT